MARSVAHTDPGPRPKGLASVAGQLMVGEFERLAQRSLTEAESEVTRALLAVCGDAEPPSRPKLKADPTAQLWVGGPRPESLAHLAAAATAGLGLRVLLLTPEAELLSHRQLRLFSRLPLAVQGENGPTRLQKGPLFVLSTLEPQKLENLIKSFAGDAPDVIFVESAHAATAESSEFRPAFGFVPGLIERLRPGLVVFGASHVSPMAKKAAREVLGASAAPELRELWENLSIQVLPENRQRDLAALLAPLPRPSVILCPTPAACDAIYSALLREQVPAHRYHAGLPSKERAAELLQFALPGRRAVLVATSAFTPGSGFLGETDGRFAEDFGRGYGRGDIQSLVHVALPASFTELGEELGLVETDRDYQSHLLIISGRDQASINLQTLRKRRPCPETLVFVAERLKGQAKGSFLPEATLVELAGGHERSVKLVLRYLRDAMAVERNAEGNAPAWRAVSRSALDAVTAVLSADFSTLSAGDRARQDEVVTWAESSRCRKEALLEALGFEGETVCGICDVCAPEARLEGGSRAPAELLRRRPPTSRRGSPERERDDDGFADDDFALEA